MKNKNTKIFCDIAELQKIKKFNKKNIVKGFTTNPSLMKKAGAKDYKLYSKKILKICPKTLSNLPVCSGSINRASSATSRRRPPLMSSSSFSGRLPFNRK